MHANGDADRMDRFYDDLVTLFAWSPSPYFRERVAVYVRSVGPGNVADLLALLLCEASEWASFRSQGIFYRNAFLTPWGLALIRQDLIRQTDQETVSTAIVIQQIQQLSESDLASRYHAYLERVPLLLDNRPDFSPEQVLREDTILRALDRERHRWRREARRRQRLVCEPASVGSDSDPTSLLEITDTVRLISLYVNTRFEEDDQRLFHARFEQGLNFRDIQPILGHRYTIPALRQRARRIRQKLLELLRLTQC